MRPLPRVLAALVGAGAFVWVGVAHAAITVTIEAPTGTPPPLVPHVVAVKAKVSSTYDLSSVRATAPSASVSLTPCGTSLCGNLDLTSAPFGAITITVTATDALGGTGSSAFAVKHDAPPTIVLTVAPIAHTVARPSITVKASCIDDDPAGCTKLLFGGFDASTIELPGTSIDGEISLAKWDGRKAAPWIQGFDSSGQWSYGNLPEIYVETSPALTEVVTVGGMIIDVDATRVMWTAPDGSIEIRDVVKGTDTHHSGYNAPSFLTPTGALLRRVSDGTYVELKAGVLTPLGRWVRNTSPAVGERYRRFVKGSHAALFSDTLGNVVRDTSTGLESALTFPAGSPYCPGTFGCDPTSDLYLALADNGDFLYSVSSGLHRIRGGVATNLGVIGWGPASDGINIVSMSFPSGGGVDFNLLPPSGPATKLTATRPYDGSKFTAIPRPGAEYQLKNGWIAYTEPSPISGVLQVWTRSPAGVKSQASVWGLDSRVDHLNASGDVMMKTNTSDAQVFRRTFRAQGGLPMDIGSGLGFAEQHGGVWYVAVGRTLFKASTTGGGGDAGPDGGSDAGVADTGTSVADTNVADTNVADTNVADTNVADTNVADTNIDTSVADSALAIDSSVASTDASSLDASARDGGPSDESGGGCNVGRAPSSGSLSFVLASLAALTARRRSNLRRGRDHA